MDGFIILNLSIYRRLPDLASFSLGYIWKATVTTNKKPIIMAIFSINVYRVSY